MLPHIGATPPAYSKIGDFSGKCGRISSKSSEISLLTRRWVGLSGVKMLKYVRPTPSWGNPTGPPPYYIICDIFGINMNGFQRISTFLMAPVG